MRVPDHDDDGLAPVFDAGVDSAGSVEVDIVPAPIFGLTASSALAFQGSWHHHQRHQLLYAAHGTLHLETHHGRWQLPPRRAAWLPAGTTHRASSAGALRIATVYLEAEQATKSPRDLRVFGASPLLQAMVLHAAAIGPRPPFSDVQRTFLEAVAAMVPAWSRVALPFVLPVGRSDELRAAMGWTRHHLANAPTVEQAARQPWRHGEPSRDRHGFPAPIRQRRI